MMPTYEVFNHIGSLQSYFNRAEKINHMGKELDLILPLNCSVKGCYNLMHKDGIHDTHHPEYGVLSYGFCAKHFKVKYAPKVFLGPVPFILNKTSQNLELESLPAWRKV